MFFDPETLLFQLLFVFGAWIACRLRLKISRNLPKANEKEELTVLNWIKITINGSEQRRAFQFFGRMLFAGVFVSCASLDYYLT
jgi:hypothetical protein